MTASEIHPPSLSGQTSASPKRFHWIDAVTLALCAAGAICPLDTQWNNDQPTLMALAIRANQAHQLAQYGLPGTRNIRYGPIAVWLFQLLLLATHNLWIVATMHALLMRAGIAVSLRWLGQTLWLSRWFVPLVLLAPYVWLSSRDLWDVNLAMPLGCALLAAYAALLQNSSAAKLALVTACAALLLTLHLMMIVIVAPLCVHMLLYARRPLARHWIAAVVALIVIGLVSAPYWISLVRALRASTASPVGNDFSGWWFPLLAGRVFSGSGLAYFFDAEWIARGGGSGFFFAAALATLVAFPLIWLGIWRAFRIGSARRASPRALIARLCAAVIIVQMIFDGVEKVSFHPHYYFGAWAADATLLWIGVDWLARRRAGQVIVAIYAAGLAFTTLWIAARVHDTGGSRYFVSGPTLASQMDLVDQLNRFSADSPVSIDVEFFRIFPLALEQLRVMHPPPPGSRPVAKLAIHYTSSDPCDAHLAVSVK